MKARLEAKQISVQNQRYTAGKITEADLPALKEATERDESKRLKPEGRSYHPDNCVMVVEEAGKIIGCVFVMFVRPPRWPNADDTSKLPQLMSLGVNKRHQNQGAGTFLIGAVEEEVKSRGYNRLYLGVDPKDNPGAHRLYLRLGFESISTEPYRSSWTYTDSDGVEHEVVEWLIDMVKKLS